MEIVEIPEGTNKAIEIMDGEAPFLQPMPSDDEATLRTIAEFALEISPEQNQVLTKLEMLALEPELPKAEKEKLLKKVAMYIARKRYHESKYFIGDALQSISWRRFAQSGIISGNVNKNSNQ